MEELTNGRGKFFIKSPCWVKNVRSWRLTVETTAREGLKLPASTPLHPTLDLAKP